MKAFPFFMMIAFANLAMSDGYQDGHSKLRSVAFFRQTADQDQREMAGDECKCLENVVNSDGFGWPCTNVPATVPQFCYVNKIACAGHNVGFQESTDINIDKSTIAWTEELCKCAPGCVLSAVGDNTCNADCYNAACNWDAGDCACQCLGVKNIGGFGDNCNHVEANEADTPYCYVSKSACDFQNIESQNSAAFPDDLTAYSYKVCEPDCECLGVANIGGYGDACNNVEPNETDTYCHVSKTACDKANVAWIDTDTIDFDIDNSVIGKSYEICPPPTNSPSTSPSDPPSKTPTTSPTASPSVSPTTFPTKNPTTSSPTEDPTKNPTTSSPTRNPTKNPTTSSPTKFPTKNPTTSSPTTSPTKNPTTSSPTKDPTKHPTTSSPTYSPTKNPTTSSPTKAPTQSPTTSPTAFPSGSPTTSPTQNPTTSSPTNSPTKNPTKSPTASPSRSPTASPTKNPTRFPTRSPTITPCYCLGIQNGDGHGADCMNDLSESAPYCYVNKKDCTINGVAWLESTSTVIDTSTIAYSEEICECKCLSGIMNSDGYGDTCANHPSTVPQFCYVNKIACTAAGVAFEESTDTDIDKANVAWSEEICTCTPGCWLTDLGDGECDPACYNKECNWDDGDCGCQCLGVHNTGQFGDNCNHVEPNESPYCYVSKSACDFANIDATNAEDFNDNKTAFSYQVCTPNCECLGVTNIGGYGDTCNNIEDEEDTRYCYVSKTACDKENVAWTDTDAIDFDIDYTLIGKSYEVCPPTKTPTTSPTKAPSGSPTTPDPSKSPSASPSNSPTKAPSNTPTRAPTKSPSQSPSKAPTRAPTKSPSKAPTKAPTKSPSKSPSKAPTKIPTASPSRTPSECPTTSTPTISPSVSPTITPDNCTTNANLNPDDYTNSECSCDNGQLLLISRTDMDNRKICQKINNVKRVIDNPLLDDGTYVYNAPQATPTDSQATLAAVNDVASLIKTTPVPVAPSDPLEPTCEECARYYKNNGGCDNASLKDATADQMLHASCLNCDVSVVWSVCGDDSETTNQ